MLLYYCSSADKTDLITFDTITVTTAYFNRILNKFYISFRVPYLENIQDFFRVRLFVSLRQRSTRNLCNVAILT